MAVTVTLSWYDPVFGTDIGTATARGPVTVLTAVNSPGSISGNLPPAAITSAIVAAFKASGNVIVTAVIGPRTFVGYLSSYTHTHGGLTPGLDYTCTGLIGLYGGVPIDRDKAYNTTIAAALTNIITRRIPGLPSWANRAIMAFTSYVPVGGTIPLAEDINATFSLPALDQLASQLAGRLGPQHGAWYANSGTGQVTIGTGAGASYTVSDDDLVMNVVDRGDNSGTASQYQAVGGSSLRGLPSSPTITSLAFVPGVNNLSDVQFMLTVSAGDTLGGSFYLTPDRLAHPFSGNVGVTAAFYDSVRSIHYLATPSGIMERYIYQGPGPYKLTTGDYVGVPASQQRTPFTLRMADVVVDGAQVYAFASGNQAGDGIWTYPYIFSAGEGSTPPLGAGSDYWKNLVGADVVCMTVLNGTLYYVVSEAPTTIVAWRNFNDPSLFDFRDKTHDHIPVPAAVAGGQAYAVTKLCRVVAGGGGVFVLTQGGSDGFYFIADGSSIAKPCNAAGTLEPTMINNVVSGGPNGSTVMACTNDGIWASASALGSRMTWFPLPDATAPGLVGRQIFFAATGDPGTAPDGASTPMVASDGQDVLDSQSNGRFWRGMLQTPVDVNTAIRNGESPGPLTAASLIDGEGETTIHLINDHAPYAPGAALAFVEASNLAATPNVSHETASSLLLQDVIRFAATDAIPQAQTEVYGEAEDDSSVLLLPEPLDTLHYSFVGNSGCDDAPGLIKDVPASGSGYVIQQQFVVGVSGVAQIQTLVANPPVTRRQSFDQVALDTQFSLSKLVRKP